MSRCLGTVRGAGAAISSSVTGETFAFFVAFLAATAFFTGAFVIAAGALWAGFAATGSVACLAGTGTGTGLGVVATGFGATLGVGTGTGFGAGTGIGLGAGAGAAIAGFATGTEGFTTDGAGLVTGTTGRATGTGTLFTGAVSFFTAGAGLPFGVCAFNVPMVSKVAANTGTKIFVIISLLLGRRYKNS